MPEKLDSTYEIYPRELILYKRPTSTVWQCRYKVDGKWLIASTKLRDREKAIERAKDLKRIAELKKEANLPVVTKKFKDIARLTKQRMDDKAKKGEAPVSYNVYKRIIDDFLIPCLGNKNIDKIDYAALKQYEEDRAKLMGKEPAYSTVRKHNVTLNYIFEEAILRGFMTRVNKPELETKGRKGENYATFSVKEINAILANFPDWIKRGRSEAKREQRELLYDYVRILIDTGARPGKELLDLQWKNIKYKVRVVDAPKQELDEDGFLIEDIKKDELIEEYDEEGNLIESIEWQPTVILSVYGKTKDRNVNGFDETFKVLKEIVARNYPDSEVTLKKLTENNDPGYVFRTRSGGKLGTSNHMFDRFLDEHNLLYDPNSGKKRVFYSFRSAHTTAVLNFDGVPLRDIALQLGNSPGIIAKHYDRATGEAIAENVRAPKARQALFHEIDVPEVYQSKKLKKQQEEVAEKKKS
ncbi:hypothetical protein ICV01_07375 [Polynucleobacter sp. MWH-Spelu-300-X4]|uniref:tyrosine-type recombinase/integrase n=1 Tax=Polynucleobacter sp. MWH-Spelu-300-X4 TaxID=2689109 RepID=UPI001BFED4AE|nr:hypothetical protein [Polynucleobacter sp. MWH-Spelu-300-X4]QWD79455.1 hypothetical protein ICV01_07375 [Polynucleobacter sp. MWH-Spelu-300-X4]